MLDRVAITGGTGLLGRYLAGELRARGISPIVLSRNSTAVSAEKTRGTDYSVPSLVTILRECRVDAVVHLAAARSADRAVDAHMRSLIAAQNVFEAAAEVGVVDVVFASTIGVYDRASDRPWSESSPVAPPLTYGVMKAAAELLIPQYPTLRVRGLRLAHLFGANEANRYMVNEFMRRARSGEPLEVNVAAEAKRDFLYAREAAIGILQALDSQSARGIYNIGAGIAHSALDIAHAVVAGFESKSEILHVTTLAAPVESSLMNIDRARDEFGYAPTRTLVDAFSEIAREMK